MDDKTIRIRDAAILRALTNSRRRPPFLLNDIRTEHKLRAAPGVRSLDDLDYFASLERLYLNWSCVDDYSRIAKLAGTLSVLQVDCSAVSNVEFVCECPTLRRVEMRFNHIEDLTPLLRHENLKNLSIDVRGNPLTEESFYESLPALEERAGYIRSLDEDVWKLQRRMWEAGHRASYGAMRGYEMVVQSLACRLGEEVRFEISPDELERELSVDGVNVEDIARKYWTPPYSREACTDRGDAEQARAWIDDADISEALADSLRKLIDRLDDGVRFAREQRRVCDAVERNIYGWHPLPEPEGGRPGLPEWFCQWRRALAFINRDGEEVPLRFGDDETVVEALRTQPVAFRPMGMASRDERRALGDRFRAFPVAWAGPDARYALVIRLEEVGEHCLYLVDGEKLFTWAFHPWEAVAFDGPAALVDALDGPTDRVDGRLAELGADPPAVRASRGALVKMRADEARKRLEEVEADEELTAALRRLVNGFEELSFHREDDRRLEFYEVLNQTRFPEWYRRWRTALAHALAPENSASQTKLKLRFRPGSFQSQQGYGQKEWSFSPPGVHQDHLRHRLIDRYGALPIGRDTHKVLAIRLDGSDRGIYTFDPTLFGANEEFDPFESRAFAGPAELVDAIMAVGTSSKWIEREN